MVPYPKFLQLLLRQSTLRKRTADEMSLKVGGGHASEVNK